MYVCTYNVRMSVCSAQNLFDRSRETPVSAATATAPATTTATATAPATARPRPRPRPQPRPGPRLRCSDTTSYRTLPPGPGVV